MKVDMIIIYYIWSISIQIDRTHDTCACTRARVREPTCGLVPSFCTYLSYLTFSFSIMKYSTFVCAFLILALYAHTLGVYAQTYVAYSKIRGSTWPSFSSINGTVKFTQIGGAGQPGTFFFIFLTHFTCFLWFHLSRHEWLTFHRA